MNAVARQVEFDRLKRQWWWFVRQYAEHVSNPTAWAWEILRRTEAYRRFHREASAIPHPRVPHRPAPGTPARLAANAIFGPTALYHEQIRAIAAKHLPLGAKDPARHWAELFLSD